MFPDLRIHTAPRVARPRIVLSSGFAIVSAIFLLVVMAALGAYMLTFSSVQQTSSAQDLQGSRAYQAARAGLEFGFYQVTRRTQCVTGTAVSLGGTLADFSVTVDCTSYPYSEAGQSVTVYSLTSTAVQKNTLPGSPRFVERQLTATLSQ